MDFGRPVFVRPVGELFVELIEQDRPRLVGLSPFHLSPNRELEVLLRDCLGTFFTIWKQNILRAGQNLERKLWHKDRVDNDDGA